MEKGKKEILNFEEIMRITSEKRISTILNNSGLTKNQRKVLESYHRFNTAAGLSIATRKTYLQIMKDFIVFVKKDFDKVTKKDIENYLVSLKDNKDSTLFNNKMILKSFFKWFYKTKDYPKIVSWIELKKNNHYKLPEELLTPEEIKKMVQVANTLRDKAIIFTLYESACRKGEFLRLKIKHVSLDEYGAKLRVEGKTGTRMIRLIDSVPCLIKWLNAHPYGDNPEAPLWVNLGAWKGEGCRAFGEDGLKRLLRVVAERAKIKKKVYPHLLRHSRLTILAKEFTESELKIIAGWTNQSNMAAVYVHLSGADIDKKLLEKAGVLKAEEEEEERRKKEILKPKTCPRCEKINSAEARFCEICGMPLDLKTAVEIEEKSKEYNEKLKKLFELWVNKNRKEVKELAKEVGII